MTDVKVPDSVPFYSPGVNPVYRYNWPAVAQKSSPTQWRIPLQIRNEFGIFTPSGLRHEIRKSVNLIQRLQCERHLEKHQGCVNSIDWSSDGRFLLSGSDDLTLTIWDVSKSTDSLFNWKSEHPNNIFCARFIPDGMNNLIASCSGDGMVIFSQIAEGDVRRTRYRCHTGTTYRVAPLLDGTPCALSCSEDKTVRLFDARLPVVSCLANASCTHTLLLNMEKTASTVAVHPSKTFEFAVGSADSTIAFYDRRNMSKAVSKIRCQTTKNMPRRITSLQYDSTGSMILANVLCEKIQLIDLNLENMLKDGTAKKLEDPKELFPTDPMPVKRLRLRGDWTDTGPQSRPGQRPPNTVTNNSSRFMVEVSDLMTTWMRNQISPPVRPEAPRQPVIPPASRSSEGGRNDSAIEDLLSNAASRSQPIQEDLIIVKPRLEYAGHRSSRTMIKESCFWDDSFVISGSDCGRFFIWDKKTAKLVNVVEGDKHVVNCVAPHPSQFLLATSGIDHDIKLWQPTAPEIEFDEESAQSIVEVNNQMLEETRDTVTVPAAAVVQILRAMARGNAPEQAGGQASGS